MFVYVPPWIYISMFRWIYPWLVRFCDSNTILFLILFWTLSVRWSATHSCGRLWYLSRRSVLFLLLLTFLSLIFICLALFSVNWVCLGHDSHDEVFKSLENRSMVWFRQEIPNYFAYVAPFHWYISFVNPVNYKILYDVDMFGAFTSWWLTIISQKIALLLSWYMIFSVNP